MKSIGLLYISAYTLDKKALTIVRVELDYAKHSGTLYYHFRTRNADRAKLTALAKFLEGRKIPKSKPITIFFDSEQLSREWYFVYRGNYEFVSNVAEWDKLRVLLRQFSRKPKVKSHGLLADSKRSELKAYLERGRHR